jgi:mannose-6-phosphate isomerase
LGGRQLDILEGKPNPNDSHFPEDWIGSTAHAINPNSGQPNEVPAMVICGETKTLRVDLISADREYFLGLEQDFSRRPTTM